MAATIGDLSVDLRLATAKFSQGVNTVNRQLGSLTRTANTVNRVFGGLLPTIGLAALAEKALSTADNFALLTAKVRNLTEETKDFAIVNRELLELSNDTGTALTENIGLFGRIKNGADELGRSNREILELVSNINKLGALGGSSANELKSATVQLSQSLAGGIVRAEEFNSIVENTPALARAIADGLNTSIGSLREMVLEGRLLADDVFGAILSQTQEIENSFRSLPPTISSASTELANNITVQVGRLNEALGVTEAIARSIKFYADAFSPESNEEKLYSVFRQLERLNAELADVQEKGKNSWFVTAPAEEQALKQQIAALEKVRDKLVQVKRDGLRAETEAEERRKAAVATANQAILDKERELAEKRDEIDKDRIRKSLARAAEEAQRKRDLITNEYAAIRSELVSEEQREQEQHLQRLVKIQEYRDLNYLNYLESDGILEAENIRHQQALTDIEKRESDKRIRQAEKERQQKIAVLTGMFGNLSTLMNTESRRLFKIGKAAAIANALVSGFEAVVHSYKFGAQIGGPPLGAAFAATAAIATAAQIQQIKSQKFGGGGSVTAGTSGGGGPGVFQPPQPQIPTGPETQGKTIQFIFNGDLNGVDPVQLGEVLKDHIENTDFVLIESSSRNGQILAGS